jgi:polysaccharide biosynthesis transport protein
MNTSNAKTNTNSQQKQDDWQLQHVMAILRRRRKIVIAAALIGGAFAITFQLFCPRRYESKSQLLVMRKDPRLAARGVEGGGGDFEVKVTEELLATHMQLLQSRSLVDGALKEEGLLELPSIVNNLTPEMKPCDYVIANMSTTRGGSGQARSAHVLNVSLKSKSMVDSERILRAVVKKYQSFLSEKFEDVNQEAASLIAQAQKELATDLEGAEHEYEQFRQQSSNLMWKAGSETTNIHRVRYEGVLQEIAALQLQRADAAARLDSINERLDGGAVELSDLEKLSLVDEKNLTRVGLLLMAQRGETESPSFQAEQPIRLASARAEVDSLAALQLKEQALLTDLGVRHPEVINVRKQLSSMQEFVDKQRDDLKSGHNSFSLSPKALFEAYHQLLQNDIVAMDRREQRLKVLADESVRLACDMVTDEIQGESLKREVDRKQQLYDAAVDRLRDINLAKDYGGFINEILSEPELGIKVMPRLRYSLPLGLMLAMGICVTGIGVAEFRDRRFRSVEEIQTALQVAVVGRVPFVEEALGKKNVLLKNKKQHPAADQSRVPRLLDAASPGADAFRVLRASRIFAEGDEFRQVLCVSSANPADGKSTTTGNLAVSLGQLGKRVLVIDCDLRRPSQHELFSLPNDRGLTSILRGDLDPTDFIQSTSHDNVFVLTRGESVDNPAEFLATGEFSRLLTVLREKYDHILLDSPPILPVVDALATAAIADGVILVMRIDYTSRLQAQAACSSLRQAGAEVDGIVLNGVTRGSLGQEGYGYGYGYEYYEEYQSYTDFRSPKSGDAKEIASASRNGGSRRGSSQF